MSRKEGVILMLAVIVLLTVPITAAIAGGGQEKAGGQTEGVTVEFWHEWNPGNVQDRVLNEMLEDFSSQHENVTVVGEYMGQSAAERITGSLAAGDPPEVAWIQSIGAKYHENDQLISMDRVYDEYIERSDIYEQLLVESQYLGEDITLPFENSNLALLHDREKLRERGIELPSSEVGEQWTWDEWISHAAKFNDHSQDQYGWEPRPNWHIAESIYRQLGGRFLSEDGRTNLVVSDPEMRAKLVEALSVVRKIFVEEAIAPVPKDDQRFGNMDMPFEISGPWDIARNMQEPIGGGGVYAPDQLGVMPLPVHEDGEPATIWYQKALALFKNDEAVERATLEFIGWFYDAPNHAYWSANASYLPVTNSAADHPTWNQYVEDLPQMQVFLDQVDHMSFAADEHYLPHGEVGEMFDSVMLDRAMPEEAVDNYVQNAQDLLDNWWQRHS